MRVRERYNVTLHLRRVDNRDLTACGMPAMSKLALVDGSTYQPEAVTCEACKQTEVFMEKATIVHLIAFVNLGEAWAACNNCIIRWPAGGSHNPYKVTCHECRPAVVSRVLAGTDDTSS